LKQACIGSVIAAAPGGGAGLLINLRIHGYEDKKRFTEMEEMEEMEGIKK